jgi:hypothetical protein
MLTGHLTLTNLITSLWFSDIGKNAAVEWKYYFVDITRRNDGAGRELLSLPIQLR